MRTEKLSYDLPPDLIAQEPLPVRSDSRLLVLKRSTGEILDSRFSSLGDFLSSGDCLVLNDTKVMPARFFARRATGAKLEGLFLSEEADGIWTVYLKGTRRLKPGDLLFLKDKHKADFCKAVLLEKADEGRCRLKLKDFRSMICGEAGVSRASRPRSEGGTPSAQRGQDGRDTKMPSPHRQSTIGNLPPGTPCGALIRNSTVSILNSIGFPPLPPYIKRDDDPARAASDASRYQTVYARRAGAVAAPTAGLHFTQSLIDQLKQAGIRFALVTLHVGAGTFAPITAENVEDHKIHREWFSIDGQNARIINTARAKGGRIIPVGTTSTRVLETAARQVAATMDDGRKDEGQNGTRTSSASSASSIEHRVSGIKSGTTELFITPGYQFRMTDALITNFHLPRSSLLALVAAFAGLDKILAAYHHAIEQRYRFYSYGDAMLIM